MTTQTPASSGEHIMRGRIKVAPKDFIVREELDFEFDEQGEHLYIYVRKCELNTNDVLEQLQMLFKCHSVDIGVSGLKDKNAISDQWFSIRTPMDLSDTDIVVLPEVDDAKLHESINAGEFGVLASHRHSRKLRRGAHQFNRFIISIRDISSQSDELSDQPQALFYSEVEARLTALKVAGFANYFGPQRFGFGRQNLPKAERYFANPKRKMSRTQRSMLISAARSEVFNSVCAERVRLGTWNTPIPGEPMLLDGSHSFYINDDSADDKSELADGDGKSMQKNDAAARCKRFDIHPTGPLWGEGDTLAVGECEKLETTILLKYTSFTQGLVEAGLKQQRRSLRASVEGLQWQWQSDDVLLLDFKLLKGVYATSFLSEFMINL